MIRGLGRVMTTGRSVAGGLRTSNSPIRRSMQGMRGDRAGPILTQSRAKYRRNAGRPSDIFRGQRMPRGVAGPGRPSRVSSVMGSQYGRMAFGNAGSRRRSLTTATGIGMGGILGANAVVAERPPSSGRNGLRPHSSGGSSLY